MNLLDDVRYAGDCVAFARERLGFEPEPWQCQLMRSTSRMIALACSRQSGKSTSTAILALHSALYNKGDIVIASRSLRQASLLFSKITGFLKLLEPVVELSEDNRLSCTLLNGNRILSLPGDAATVRGISNPQWTLLDEAAQIDDNFYAAVRPFLAHGGRIAVLSSPFGRRGFFFEIFQSGAERGWELIRVPATEVEHISREFLENERRETSDWMFRQEYMCEFLETTSQVFGYDLVMNAFSDSVKPVFTKEEELLLFGSAA